LASRTNGGLEATRLCPDQHGIADKTAFTKEVRATFGVPPEIDAGRPVPLAELLSRRGLGCDGLAFDDGECCTQRLVAAEAVCAAVGEKWGFLVRI